MKITVFGGSGSLGIALIQKLIELDYNESDITSVSRNEASLVELKQRFPRLDIIVGDIADPWVVKKAMKMRGQVYLLSAMKHVGLAEKDVRACVQTNIVGTMNVIRESLEAKPLMLMFISSDKAAQVTGVYGATKRIGEKLMEEAQAINFFTTYKTIRYGNVWGSAGSIITKWRPKLEKGEEVILTDPDASRFFWPIEEAVDMIMTCAASAKDPKPLIPKMKAVKMGVVLEACMEVYGKSPVKIIGLQPGENKAETTDGVVFSDTTEQFTKEEFIQKFLQD